jgi:hypothetical protein
MKLILWICLCILLKWPAIPATAQTKDYLSEQQHSFKQKIEQLWKEGKLTEVAGSVGNSAAVDAHYWTYDGKLVKMTRRWKFMSAITFSLPPVMAIEKVVFSYENGWRKHVISDSAEKELLCEVIQSGSFKRDEGEETQYYMDSQNSFGIRSGDGNTEMSFSGAPTSLKFFSGKNEILSIEVWYDHNQNSHPGDEVVEKVKRYIVRRKSSKDLDYNFENPTLDTIIEKYTLDITRELGLKFGK